MIALLRFPAHGSQLRQSFFRRGRAAARAARSFVRATSQLRGWLIYGSLFLGLVGRGPSQGAEPQVTAEGAVVDLPTFTVTDTRILPPPESWRYTEIPGFEILSNASDRTTQKMIHDFEMFHDAMAAVWKAADRPSSVPISIILCARQNRFQAFVPNGGMSSDSTPPDATRPMNAPTTMAVVLEAGSETGTPINEARSDVGLTSLFLKDREQASIVIDLESPTLQLSTPEALANTAAAAGTADGFANTDFEVDHYKQLYREYVHYVLSGIQPRAPAWLEEGLAQLFMGLKFDKKIIRVAEIEDPNRKSILPGQEDEDFNKTLNHRALMPLQEFFTVPYDSPIARNNLGSTWAKQAQEFVHMCLYGRGQRYLKSFVTFVQRTQNEPVTEALFKECFKMSYKDMLLELRGYTDFTDYKMIEFRTPKGQSMPDPPPLVIRAATEGEVGRIKGDALRMGGHAELARLTLIAPYLRGDRDPRLLAALGLAERALKQDERAQKFLEAAALGKVKRPRAYLELARLRYQAAQLKPGAADGQLDAAQLAGVAEPLVTAWLQPPVMPEVPVFLAKVWTESPLIPDHNSFVVLFQSVQHFPRAIELLYQTAALSIRAGLANEAGQMVEFGMKTSADPETAARFAALKAKLPADFAAPGKPGP